RGGRVTAVGAALSGLYPNSDVHDLRISLTREVDLADVPRRSEGDERPLELLTVGRVAPEKNPFLLLDAVRELNTNGVPARLTWVGAGELLAEAASRVDRLGMHDEVRFAGHMPFGKALLDVYRTADVFVHVALTEGVPQVVYEAFAAGLPVVATDVGGVSEATGGGAAALLVPPDDLEALLATLERVATDSGLAERLARAGLEIARGHTLESTAADAAQFLAAGARRP
ncbi:MAG: glycosyltransferase, partial [Gaiellaceae bacterium]